MLYLVAFALGVGETFYDTAAQSIVPSLVGPPSPDRANSRLYAVEVTANQFVGPAMGGLIAGIALTGALSASAAAYASPPRSRCARRQLPAGAARRRRPGCAPTSSKVSATSPATRCCGRWPSASASPTWRRRRCSPSSRCSPSTRGRWASTVPASVCSWRAWPPGPCADPSWSTDRPSTRSSPGAAVAGCAVRSWPRPGRHEQRPVDRRRVRNVGSDRHRVERAHGVAAPADRPRPPAGSRERRVPADGMGHDADRRRHRRVRRRTLRADCRVLDHRRAGRALSADRLHHRHRQGAGRRRSTPVARSPGAAAAAASCVCEKKKKKKKKKKRKKKKKKAAASALSVTTT